MRSGAVWRDCMCGDRNTMRSGINREFGLREFKSKLLIFLQETSNIVKTGFARLSNPPEKPFQISLSAHLGNFAVKFEAVQVEQKEISLRIQHQVGFFQIPVRKPFRMQFSNQPTGASRQFRGRMG